ncbi:MAG: DUF6491 family protein [Steroidobacteraceae bacterium]
MLPMRTRLPRLPVAAALAVAVVAAVAGCASSAQLSKEQAALPGKPACFFLANFQGDWTVLNDTSLIVSIPPSARDAYLIKLFEPIYSLRFQEHLGFQDVEHSGQICNGSDDKLVVRERGQPPVPIVAVRQITPLEQRQLLRAAGLKVPRYLQKQIHAGHAPGASG